MKTACWRLRLLRSFLLLGLALSLGCPMMSKKETKKEREIPDAEAQAQKKKEILELFKDKDDSATFYEKGLQTKDDPAGRFVLLSLARDKAADELEYRRAFDAVDELAKSFDDVDALEMKKDVVIRLAKASKSPDDFYDVTDHHALKLIDQCLDADKYEAANALLDLADETRKKARPEDQKNLQMDVAAKKRKAQEIEKEFEEVKGARDTLETKPDDKDANLAWGKFVCTVKGNWDKGLPMLEKGSDKDLAALAKTDLDKPSNGDEQVRLGDKWWELAQPEQGLARENLKGRAVYWYKKAESAVAGLTQERIKKNIREVEKKE